MSLTNDHGSPPRRRWLKVVFVVSLALNLLFVGLAASAAWMFWNHGGGSSRHAAFVRAVTKVMEDLPEDRRSLVEVSLRKHREALDLQRRQMREARKSAKAALTAETYSEPRVREALAKMAEARNRIRLSKQETVLSLMPHLNQQERERFMRHLKRARSKGRGWRKHLDERK